MKITVVYDNNAGRGLKTGWGFSCLIDNGKKILFDCGDSGEKLIFNMKKLGMDPKDIGSVLLSHEHWDHIGGLLQFLEMNDRVTVYVPKSFSTGIKEKIGLKAGMKEVDSGEEISENVYTTGQLGGPGTVKEQSVALKTSKGYFIITGCAHPGLKAIIEKSRSLGKIYGIMGGFHDFSDFGILKGMELVAPCHCTQNAREIKRLFPGSYREIKSGSVIEL
ncbi:MAG: MBL fold metallo-hydrolase [Candidatus Aenigmarchaeota archaeon]|nr:MBL fold metallo-hydrolase [Candidatus Aenigmarchaeota archaeon]